MEVLDGSVLTMFALLPSTDCDALCWGCVLLLSPPPFPVCLSLSSFPLSSSECACVSGGLSAPGETGECGCNCLFHIVPRMSVWGRGGVDRHHHHPHRSGQSPWSSSKLHMSLQCPCKHTPFSLSLILSLSLYLTPLESKCRSLSLISYLYLFFSLLSRVHAVLSILLLCSRVYIVLSHSYSIFIWVHLSTCSSLSHSSLE